MGLNPNPVVDALAIVITPYVPAPKGLQYGLIYSLV